MFSKPLYDSFFQQQNKGKLQNGRPTLSRDIDCAAHPKTTFNCSGFRLVMTLPAARIGDMHMCPMVTPSVPPIPHVGGPILPPGGVTTLIGGVPAARVSDMCVCVGPPDVIAKGSMTVLINGMPAARMGDLTAHGGTIVVGMPTVLIGG